MFSDTALVLHSNTQIMEKKTKKVLEKHALGSNPALSLNFWYALILFICVVVTDLVRKMGRGPVREWPLILIPCVDQKRVFCVTTPSCIASSRFKYYA